MPNFTGAGFEATPCEAIWPKSAKAMLCVTFRGALALTVGIGAVCAIVV